MAPKTLYVTTRDEWRAWLATHHARETETWLVFYKKHSGRPRIAYDDAVEEAICFGWIDSLVKRIDDDAFMQKFTPRRDSSRWSEVNKRRLRKVIREGRMTEAGLAKVAPGTLSAKSRAPKESDDVEIPRSVKQALAAHPVAWKTFQRLTPARQRAYVRLMTDGKTAETRERQLRKAIELLEQNTGDVQDLPRFLKQALMKNAKAWQNFQNLAPSYRRHYVGWIMHAKQDATRERRIKEAVSLLAQNRKLGLK